jgi:hypothetical protein
MLCAAKIADKQHFAVNPLKLTSSKLADGVTMDNQQTVTFVNKGIAIQAQPAVQDLQALQNSLFELLKIDKLSYKYNGNLHIPYTEQQWISVRAEIFATDTDKIKTEIGVIPHSKMENINLAYLIFKDETGQMRQQVFYPAAAVTADVAEVSQGILNFKWQDKNYSGILDYLVTSSKTTQTQEFQILPIHDVNADGTQDFEITYSTGDKQILFTLPR